MDSNKLSVKEKIGQGMGDAGCNIIFGASADRTRSKMADFSILRIHFSVYGALAYTSVP